VPTLHLGKETTYRVLSYKMAKDVCCIMVGLYKLNSFDP
jgi:hypothetical protein